MSPTLQPIAVVHSALMDRSIMTMDPELQKAVVLHRSGLKKKATSSTAQDEISVLAKVSNAQAWLDMTEVRSPTVIGKPDENRESIVTGRIPIKLIEKIRILPFISSLKAARRIKPALAATIKDMEAGNNLPDAIKFKGGKGAVVGIIDFGCDFTHKNFLKAAAPPAFASFGTSQASGTHPVLSTVSFFQKQT